MAGSAYANPTCAWLASLGVISLKGKKINASIEALSPAVLRALHGGDHPPGDDHARPGGDPPDGALNSSYIFGCVRIRFSF